MRGGAILVAWVLVAQTIGPSLALASTARASCCCGSDSAKKCHCPACAKTRAIEENQGLVGGCGHGDSQPLPASIVVGAPVRAEVLPAPAPMRRSPAPSAAAPASPSQEVPTPPPLA